MKIDRMSVKAFAAAAIVSATATSAAYAHAAYTRVSGQACTAPANATNVGYSNGAWIGLGGASVDCPLPDSDVHPKTTIVSYYADTMVYGNVRSTYSQACVIHFNAGGGACGPTSSATVNGFTGIGVSAGWYFLGYPNDYGYAATTLANGSSLNGIYVAY